MKRFKPIALWLGALIVVATALLYVESDFLWKVQQYNLFLYSSLFFKQMMTVSGGMLSYLGTFFTQFFYHPWIGVIMLCSWWLLLMWLVKRTFAVSEKWLVVTLIPAALLLVANMDLGYWIYVMKLHGHFFSSTIGTTAGVALLWGFRKLPEKLWLRICYVVLVVAAGYPLMGIYALTAAFLMGVWIWRLSRKVTPNIILSAITLLAIAAIPLIYYRYVYFQTNIHDIYYTALPIFTITETLHAYHIPYYLLAVCFLGFVVAYNPTSHTEQKDVQGKQKAKGSKTKEKSKKTILNWILQGAILAAITVGVWHFWYKDDNFHHELRMERCIEQADWEGVLEEGKKQDGEPTRAIVMMHNLALSRLGLQCENMYSFPKGSKKTNTSVPVYMYNTAGRLIYYHYGVMNECHRMCMEEGVEYGWSVELLQYMVRNAIFTNEKQVAKKYLNLLRKTQYYGDWADHMESLINNPELLSSDMETGPITHMLNYADIQSQGDSYVEKNLMTMLSETDSKDPYFQEQAVLGAMWTRNTSNFWARFEQYLNLHPNRPVPRIFQEAAYLFGNMEQLSFTEDLPIDRSVKENFQGFMQMMQQCQGRPNGQQRKYLYQRYGTTYYFEYFFLRDITYY
ncbi:DUF6057 family protein [Prevotella sp. E2-28]|uniref:DUF6057 family protein n=1 Tax=Prevotella sp. E2-28 TaxID=2913620 RepID=UPI001EDB2A9D|nr:DUF6057 family protein [Prevotella sp. E2-28]UKK53484.1 DUF6057 family protein [Prevotella sp. E2-28]